MAMLAPCKLDQNTKILGPQNHPIIKQETIEPSSPSATPVKGIHINQNNQLTDMCGTCMSANSEISKANFTFTGEKTGSGTGGDVAMDIEISMVS